MFEKINFRFDRVFPIIVTATMSSGKSTLINSLAGFELLPSLNGACTAKAVAILDNDQKAEFEVHAVDKKGKYTHLDQADKRIVNEFNSKNNISEMIIEGEIRGIRNSSKSMLLIDTPGINNSLNEAHAKVTEKVLEQYKEGLILYVINAQQIGTYDDSIYLRHIVKKLEKSPALKILFVLNKMDLVDPEKEDVGNLVKNCAAYIIDMGVKDPTIIPVSAVSALLFKKVLSGQTLSDFEEENFFKYFRYFRRDGYSLQDYIISSERIKLQEKVIVDGDEYLRADIYAALDATGIPYLEKQIDNEVAGSIKLSKAKIISRKNKTRKKKNSSRTRKAK